MSDGKIAVVTGGASGIGLAIVEKFLAEGWSVLAVEKQAETLERLIADRSSTGERLRGLELDVTSDYAPGAIFEACEEAFGKPRCLVNNAGKGNAKSVYETSDADLDFYLDLNLRSVFRMCRQAGKAMGAGDSIVNVASSFGMVGFRGSAPYSAAKAGVIGLTRQIAADFGPQGIRVNAVAPGIIVTPATIDRVRSNVWLSRAMVDTTPLRRTGTPEEVAEAVYFLGSDAARYINAVILSVDGGWTGTRFYPDL